MKDMLKPVLWSVISLLLLCSFAVPGLNMLAMLLIFVPMTVLYTTTTKKIFAACVIAVLAIAAIVIEPITMIILGLIALIPSVVLGHMYMNKAKSTRIIPYVTAIVLLVLMVSLLLLDVLFSVSLVSEFKTLMQSQYTNLSNQALLPATFTPEVIEGLTNSMVNLVPLAMAMMAYMLVVVSHFVARRIVNTYGVEVTPFPEAKDWNLPRKLVFIYFIFYFVELFMDLTTDSFLTIAVLNIVPALSFVFTVQAIGFLFFLAHHYKWPKIVPLLLVIPALFIPLFSLLGVIVVAFNLKQRIAKK